MKSVVFPGDSRFIFDRAPLLVYWEATRACDLACIHCRAEAVARRHPLELQTEEARRLLEQIAGFGGQRLPHLIITGGDPLQRSDLFALIAYGRQLGLTISVTPAGTRKLTAEVIRQLKATGIASLGLSLDGSNAARHDAFRGEQGSFQWTVRAAQVARAEAIPVQINTMVTAQTLEDLQCIYEAVKDLGIARWALFFLIATGRGQALAGITPEQ
ncbi:MAG TPA: radical SAM protein, partial [Anaerolineae bacterium]